MIIVGYYGVGKTSLEKNNPNLYIDYDAQEAKNKYGKDWLHKYINSACLLSDIGYQVCMPYDSEIIHELMDKKLDVLAVYPTKGLMSLWLNKLRIKSLTSKNKVDEDNYKKASEHFLSDILLLESTNFTMHLPITSLDYDLDKAIKIALDISGSKYKSTHYQFIWGIPKYGKEKASFETANLFEIVLDKKDNRFYMTFDIDQNFITEKERKSYYKIIFDKLASWYDDIYMRSFNLSKRFYVKDLYRYPEDIDAYYNELDDEEKLNLRSATSLFNLILKFAKALS